MGGGGGFRPESISFIPLITTGNQNQMVYKNRTQPAKSLSFRSGQGPFSTKKWVRDLFKGFGDPAARQKTEYLFQSEGQAERALRKYHRAINKARQAGKPVDEQRTRHKNGALSTPHIPRHIFERGLAARLYLPDSKVSAIDDFYAEENAGKLYVWGAQA